MVDGRPMSVTSFRSGSARSKIEPLTELQTSNTSLKSPSLLSSKTVSNHSIISVSQHVDEESKVGNKWPQKISNFESFIVSIFISKYYTNSNVEPI